MIELECGDFRELIQQVPDESVTLILSDPPYPREYRPLITPLAEQSQRVLIPVGHLILYCGNYCVPDWSRRIEEAGLYHRALMWLQHSGRCQLLPELKMRMDGKPILVSSRIWRTYPNRVLSNVVIGGGRAKRWHPWQQDLDSAKHLIEHYTKPGDLVLDPFAGSGTVLLAAWLLGRRALGFEIDPQRCRDACDRLDEEIGKGSDSDDR